MLSIVDLYFSADTMSISSIPELIACCQNPPNLSFLPCILFRVSFPSKSIYWLSCRFPQLASALDFVGDLINSYSEEEDENESPGGIPIGLQYLNASSEQDASSPPVGCLIDEGAEFDVSLGYSIQFARPHTGSKISPIKRIQARFLLLFSVLIFWLAWSHSVCMSQDRLCRLA